MKKSVIYTLLAAIPLVYSCTRNTDKTGAEGSAAQLDSVAKNECYTAIDSNDKAELAINTLNNNEVKGNLVINYFEKGKNDGLISGKFHGDTLFVDYTFKIGTENPTVYKNPLAFLKQGDSLILGVGSDRNKLRQVVFC